MKNILLIHGANLNALGRRDPTHYGNLTLHDLEQLTRHEAAKYGVSLVSFQSNHEGALIDFLQQHTPQALGIIINAGAFSHYSYALHDALVDCQLPAIEVHLSDISQREAWRRTSVLRPACIDGIMGKRQQGYLEAVQRLMQHLAIS